MRAAFDARAARLERGFTLVEMIIVVFLLAVAMLGILAVFDASARINKSESEVADAQGSVRFGIYQMTRAIRMAGTGGLFVTQAVLNAPDPNLTGAGKGMTLGSVNGYDNVTSATVTNLVGTNFPVRDGTDMIEVRGVINSPLLGFDRTTANGCGVCTGVSPLTAKTKPGDDLIGTHVNDDPQRPQFAAIDAFTAGAVNFPMYVIVSQNDSIHAAYPAPSAQNPSPVPHYPQPIYNVASLTTAPTLAGSQTFGNINFGDAVAVQFNGELPATNGTAATPLTNWLRHAGVLEDLVFFIDNTDPNHPALAQGTRRGLAFDVVTLADDVEDMQIAYGVDTDANDQINRTVAASGADPDENVSTVVGQDEWVPNLPGDTVPASVATHFTVSDFVTNSGTADPAIHFPRLHAVMVSLVAKSKNSDPTYRAPNALGFVIMNSVQTPVSGQFRRRIQTIKINLRNYAFD
jgi:prepilin-type N-terminal cleavage/methylation domain-containing protein